MKNRFFGSFMISHECNKSWTFVFEYFLILSQTDTGIDSRFTMMYKEQAYGNVFPPYPHLSPPILSFFLLIAYLLTSHSLTLILIVIMKSFLISALLTFGCHGCFALDRTTEANEASITGRFQLGFKFHEAKLLDHDTNTTTHLPVDPQSECSPYYYPDLAAHQTELPEAWKTATILSSDSEAQSLWKSIESKVPNIPPKVCFH